MSEPNQSAEPAAHDDAPASQPDVPPSQPDALPSQPSSSGWTPSYVFLALLTIINLVADIASKQWIKAYFEQPGNIRRKIVLVDGYANFIYATNKGGAWGILQGEHESLRRPFFLIVSVAAIVFIISLYRKLTRDQRALKWGLPLVLGGALGNLFDRVVYGHVIDFIDVYTKVGADEKHWPTFNVADISICVGVGLMAIDMFTSRASEKSKSEPRPESGPSKLVGSEPAPASESKDAG